MSMGLTTFKLFLAQGGGGGGGGKITVECFHNYLLQHE